MALIVAFVSQALVALIVGVMVWLAAPAHLLPNAPWLAAAVAGFLSWMAMLAVSAFLRSAVMQMFLQWGRRHPRSTVMLVAIVATCVSCWPVMFDGQSFVSPRNGAPGVEVVLPHDKPLSVPGFRNEGIEDVHSGDIGAMLFHHLPYSMVQERSIRFFGEFPLWNRFNAGGQSMPAQGQAMLGDPLNWILWLAGVDSASYDGKFVVLRIIFAAALGWSVLILTRSLFASALVTLAAPFIGEFVFRINHPAIFSLCWSPVLLLAWLHLADARARQIAWALVLVVLANWLMLNSGTVKEAVVSALVLNGIGAVHAARSALRETAAKRLRLTAVLAVGPLSVLIGVPVWAPLLDAILHGWSAYGEPVAMQLPLYEAAGFVDNVFFLISDDVYQPAVNVLLSVGAIAALFALSFKSAQSVDSRAVSKLLTVASFACLATSFGLVPSAVLLSAPFIRSIHHIHNTFMTASITPVCVLAGIGFAQARRLPPSGRWRSGKAALATIAILMAASILFTPVDRSTTALIYGAALLVSTAVAIWWLERPDLFALSTAQVGAVSIALLLMLGRGAQWGDVTFDDYVFNPKARIDYVADLPVISTARAAFSEPVRMVTAGVALFSGYHVVLGLESIDGPEALQERPYRQLIEALHVPYDWHWRLKFDDDSVVRHRGMLDLLGVGLVFSSQRMTATDDLRQIASDPPLYVYARANPWPRAFFANGVKTYDTIDGLVAMADAAHEPFVALPSSSAAANESVRMQIGKGEVIVRARDYVLTNNTTSFTVDAASAGVIYLAESDEPGNFSAYLDGIETPYLTANGAFKAIPVPRAGTYRVKVEFWPRRLTLYLATGMAGLLLLAALALHLRRAAIVLDRGREVVPRAP